MKIGDMVMSARFELMGRIQDIGPCTGTPDRCCEGKLSLTIDPPERMARFYYHADEFVVVEPDRK